MSETIEARFEQVRERLAEGSGWDLVGVLADHARETGALSVAEALESLAPERREMAPSRTNER